MCILCSKVFSMDASLKKHISVHQCPMLQPMSKYFLKQFDLNSYSRIHTGERPYLCNQCPRLFAQKEKLKIDIRFHIGEKLLSCIVNPKRILHNSLYWKHTEQFIQVNSYFLVSNVLRLSQHTVWKYIWERIQLRIHIIVTNVQKYSHKFLI